MAVELLGKVKANATFSNGVISMAKGEVMEVYSDNPFADMFSELFEAGLVENYTDPIVPEGNLDITENGEHDVAQYATVTVAVE